MSVEERGEQFPLPNKVSVKSTLTVLYPLHWHSCTAAKPESLMKILQRECAKMPHLFSPLDIPDRSLNHFIHLDIQWHSLSYTFTAYLEPLKVTQSCFEESYRFASGVKASRYGSTTLGSHRVEFYWFVTETNTFHAVGSSIGTLVKVKADRHNHYH